MGKHLFTSEESTIQIQNNNPGCMWGMFQILDYHHWRVKKVFPHKKTKHARYKRKTILHNQGEDQQYGVEEAETLLVRQHGEKLSATGKSSHKNSKKEPHTVKRFNEENSGKKQASSEYVLHLEKDSKTTEAALSQKHMETNKLNKDISNKFKKGTDVLEVFRVEKDLLVKFLRNLDIGGKNFRKASQNKARLTKSGSFPLTASSQMRKVSSSTFKHKQNEIWAFPKGEKLLAGTQAPKMSASSFVKDISYEKPMHLVSDLGADSAMEQNPSISSRSSQGLTHKGWNQLVLHQFKIIKQKIKHALVEFKKSAYQTSVETIHHTDSSEYSIPNNEKEVSQSLDDGMIQEYRNNKSSNETEASDYDSNKHEVPLMRRTSSINESLDRYTQLFEKSFRKEVNWQSSKSKSLRLSNEDKIHRSGHAPKFSRSNLSLPNLEFLGFILHEALSDTNDTVETENQVHRKSVSLHLKTDKSPDQFKEAEIAEIVEGSDTTVHPSPLSDKVEEKIDGGVIYDIYEPAVADGSFPQEKEEISMTTYLSKEVMASVETSCEDNTSSLAAEAATEIIGDCFGQIIPVGELNTRGSTLDELETDLPDGANVYSLPDSLSNTNASVTVEDTNKSDDNHFLLFKSDTDKDSNFKYVKEVLEFSGFMGNEHIQMPYTVDQPIKPSLLMDLDASLSNEIKSSEEEIINPYDHQLLFNLVNEVLLEIYERSPTYFPRPFSFNHRLHPMPKGNYLLNQVWTSVNSYLSLRPELDQTLDDVVGRDLAKRSGWMNLQHEEECVALELEEMIIDDLLDEIFFS